MAISTGGARSRERQALKPFFQAYTKVYHLNGLKTGLGWQTVLQKSHVKANQWIMGIKPVLVGIANEQRISVNGNLYKHIENALSVLNKIIDKIEGGAGNRAEDAALADKIDEIEDGTTLAEARFKAKIKQLERRKQIETMRKELEAIKNAAVESDDAIAGLQGEVDGMLAMFGGGFAAYTEGGDGETATLFGLATGSATKEDVQEALADAVGEKLADNIANTDATSPMGVMVDEAAIVAGTLSTFKKYSPAGLYHDMVVIAGLTAGDKVEWWYPATYNGGVTDTLWDDTLATGSINLALIGGVQQGFLVAGDDGKVAISTGYRRGTLGVLVERAGATVHHAVHATRAQAIKARKGKNVFGYPIAGTEGRMAFDRQTMGGAHPGLKFGGSYRRSIVSGIGRVIRAGAKKG